MNAFAKRCFRRVGAEVVEVHWCCFSAGDESRNAGFDRFFGTRAGSTSCNSGICETVKSVPLETESLIWLPLWHMTLGVEQLSSWERTRLPRLVMVDLGAFELTVRAPNFSVNIAPNNTPQASRQRWWSSNGGVFFCLQKSMSDTPLWQRNGSDLKNNSATSSEVK